MDYLPPSEGGYLPCWLLFTSLLAVGNALQAYLTTAYTSRVYLLSPMSPLSSRTFGTWTFLAAVVRVYAAYHITDPVLYELALWTYGVAWVHFVSEWWVFGSARWGEGLAGPVVVASATGVWMGVVWGGYVG